MQYDFNQTLARHDLTLRAATVDTLQVNVGKVCNQACKHCHVDASPKRTESMASEVVEAVLEATKKFRIPVLDITGGAPELNPSFRRLVTEAHALGAHIIVRHNLTVMFEAGQSDLPEFFRAHSVEVVSSLPYFLESQTDSQRGGGVFEKSIKAIRLLNEVGYGKENGGDNSDNDDSKVSDKGSGVKSRGLELHLVYNPVGAFLPPSQATIEADFKRELLARHDIRFNRLFTITNMPIKRFLDYLRRSGNEEKYMRKLVEAFNPAAIDNLMCRSLVSVDWTGRLYDCDFNQMLELAVESSAPQTIFDFDPERLHRRRITTGNHCFGCTAGSGSSCGGAVIKE